MAPAPFSLPPPFLPSFLPSFHPPPHSHTELYDIIFFHILSHIFLIRIVIFPPPPKNLVSNGGEGGGHLPGGEKLLRGRDPFFFSRGHKVGFQNCICFIVFFIDCVIILSSYLFSSHFSFAFVFFRLSKQEAKSKQNIKKKEATNEEKGVCVGGGEVGWRQMEMYREPWLSSLSRSLCLPNQSFPPPPQKKNKSEEQSNSDQKSHFFIDIFCIFSSLLLPHHNPTSGGQHISRSSNFYLSLSRFFFPPQTHATCPLHPISHTHPVVASLICLLGTCSEVVRPSGLVPTTASFLGYLPFVARTIDDIVGSEEGFNSKEILLSVPPSIRVRALCCSVTCVFTKKNKQTKITHC